MALHLPAHTLSDAPPSPVTAVHLNADHSVFATSTVEGWVVYRTYPLQVLTRRDLPNASLSIVLPLERTNLLFLVGGPPSPLYPPNKVILWDARTGKAVAELEFREQVRGLRARRDRLIVVLRRRVLVFVLAGLPGANGIWREGVYETCDNPKGLAALATAPSSTLLAFPGRQPGQVQLVRLPPLSPTHSTAPVLAPPPPSHDPTAPPHPTVSVLLAHESPLAALATNPSGRVLATGSDRGTLVRVWDTVGPSTGGSGGGGGTLMRELRRGTDSAEIFDVALSREGDRVAVSSDKGSVHVWDLRRREGFRSWAAEDESGRRGDESPRRTTDSGTSTPRRQKQFSLLKPYLPKYFSSEWSHAQFRLPPPPPRGPTASAATTAAAAAASFFSSPATSSTAAADRPTHTPQPQPQGGRTVEDDVCVCAWIELQRPSPPPPPSSAATAADTADRPRTETQLVALTRSGGWYRLAFPSSDTGTTTAAAGGGESVQDKDKGKGRASSLPGPGENYEVGGGGGGGVHGLARDATRECRVIEYRRFGDPDGW